MRRSLCILLATLTLLSLLLCIASAVFWIGTRRVAATLTLTPFPIEWSLSTSSGTLFLTCNRSWLDPVEVRGGIRSFTYERSCLGFGIKQSQQSHSWPVTSSGSITYETVTKSLYVPLWFCFAVSAILPVIQLPRLLRRLRRRRLGLCPHCGYDVRASPTRCPECGTSIQPNQNQKSPIPVPC